MATNQELVDAGTGDVRWRVTTTTGVQFACRVNVIGARVEVRLTSATGRTVCATVVSSLDAATAVVRGWLRVLVANDGAEELIANARVDVVH